MNIIIYLLLLYISRYVIKKGKLIVEGKGILFSGIEKREFLLRATGWTGLTSGSIKLSILLLWGSLSLLSVFNEGVVFVMDTALDGCCYMMDRTVEVCSDLVVGCIADDDGSLTISQSNNFFFFSLRVFHGWM